MLNIVTFTPVNAWMISNIVKDRAKSARPMIPQVIVPLADCRALGSPPENK